MAADLITLPFWPFRPNWSDGISERLEWLTSVRPSGSGSEQRRACRLTPRRHFEFAINPTLNERTFADLFLHRMANEEMLLPLWHDRARLTADLASGGSSLVFDNTYREHLVGQCAVLYRDTFNYEIIEIDATADGGLTAVDTVAQDWPIGSSVFPLRPARLTAESNFAALTGRVGEAQVLMTLSRENTHAADQNLTFTVDGIPVLLLAPNRENPLDIDYQRLRTTLDNQTGRIFTRDVAGRSFTTQIHNWTCYGRQQQAELRDLLYWMRGRARALWVPTFNDDVRVSRNAAIGADRLDIDNIGYDYTGGAIDGRNRLLFRLDGGPEALTIADAEDGLTAEEERLVLDPVLDAAIAADTYGSFLEVARLDQDTVEITHHTDSDGVCEFSGAFRSFRNARDESVALVHGIP